MYCISYDFIKIQDYASIITFISMNDVRPFFQYMAFICPISYFATAYEPLFHPKWLYWVCQSHCSVFPFVVSCVNEPGVGNHDLYSLQWLNSGICWARSIRNFPNIVICLLGKSNFPSRGELNWECHSGIVSCLAWLVSIYRKTKPSDIKKRQKASWPLCLLHEPANPETIPISEFHNFVICISLFNQVN